MIHVLYLFAEAAVVSTVQAALVELVADHRLRQSLQEDEQSLGHRVVTASYRTVRDKQAQLWRAHHPCVDSFNKSNINSSSVSAHQLTRAAE